MRDAFPVLLWLSQREATLFCFRQRCCAKVKEF
jgi:hypothetical protein